MLVWATGKAAEVPEAIRKELVSELAGTWWTSLCWTVLFLTL